MTGNVGITYQVVSHQQRRGYDSRRLRRGCVPVELPEQIIARQRRVTAVCPSGKHLYGYALAETIPMLDRATRLALFTLYQSALAVGIALLPVAVLARRAGVTLPVRRLVECTEQAYKARAAN